MACVFIVCLFPPAISIAGVFGDGYALVGEPRTECGVGRVGVAGCLDWVALFFLICRVGLVCLSACRGGGAGILPLLVWMVAGSRGTWRGYPFALYICGGGRCSGKM